MEIAIKIEHTELGKGLYSSKDLIKMLERYKRNRCRNRKKS